MIMDKTYFKYEDNHIVNFILDDLKLENIKLKIEYRIDNPDLIVAKFKCKNEQYIDFEKLVERHSHFRVETELKNNYAYFSDNAIIKEYRKIHGEEEFEGIILLQNYYNKFIFENESTSYSYFDRSERVYIPIKEKRYIEFQLLKPYDIWSGTSIHEIMKNNKEFVDRVNNKNKLILENYEISYYVKEIKYSTNSEIEFYEVSKKRVFVKISEIDKSNLNDDKCMENMIKLFEDLLLLISFVSTCNIDWLTYNFNGNEYAKWFLKGHNNLDKVSIKTSGLIIENHYLNDYLINSYKNLQNLKNNINLVMPIKEYLAHKFAVYLEQQFLIVFIAFEKLCNDVSKWKFKNLNILDKSKFKKVDKQLKSFLDKTKFDFENEELEKIKEKLGELNRTSMKRKLLKLLKHFEIQFEKALDENENFKFLEVRNSITHTNKYQNTDLLIQEYERVRKFFEIIVLNLLDKNSLLHLHPDFKYSWERTLEY